MTKRTLRFLRYLPIILLIVINLTLGVIFVKDYGESWDEPIVYAYGSRTIQVYSNFLLAGKAPTWANEPLANYGPFYYAAGEELARLFMRLVPAWSHIDSWHLVNFITFQIGILCLYFLSKRWMKSWAAFATALLFSTQPLLWGHAFINPKDISFMTFFLASVTLGYVMVDRVSASAREESRSKSGTPSGQTAKNQENPVRLESRQAGRRFIAWAEQAGRLLVNPWVLGAGLVLGLATSIRVLGPMAGGIVMLYAIYKSWKKALVLLAPYALVAILTTYLSWPYLWASPVYRYLESVVFMSHFPFEGSILFQGALFPQGNLPKIYLPYLMAIQLTEVVLPLFIAGLLLSVWQAWKTKQIEPFVLILFWFVLPLTAIIFSSTIYFDNFRHLLFLMPPIFIAVGIALEGLLSRIKWNILRGAIVCLLVIPGILAGISLHPYQFVYYNSDIGGVRGAQGRFTLEYWGVSFAESARYVNEIAPTGASVVIYGPEPIFQDYARPDLKVYASADVKPGIHYDFVVIYSRINEVETVCPSVRAAKTIARDGAVLGVVKIPPVSGSGCP